MTIFLLHIISFGITFSNSANDYKWAKFVPNECELLLLINI